jgi:aspartyl protease family protein
VRSANKHLLQEAVQWTLVGATLFLGVYFFDDLKNLVDSTGRELRLTFAAAPSPQAENEPGFSGEVRLKADRRGHFVFTGKVDGRPVTFMADTGASIVALTYEDARRAGLSPGRLDFNARVSTANGIATVAPRRPVAGARGQHHGAQCPSRRGGGRRARRQPPRHELLGGLESFNMRGNELILIQ